MKSTSDRGNLQTEIRIRLPAITYTATYTVNSEPTDYEPEMCHIITKIAKNLKGIYKVNFNPLTHL